MVLKVIVHSEMDLLTLMLFQTCIMLFFNEAQKKKLSRMFMLLCCLQQAVQDPIKPKTLYKNSPNDSFKTKRHWFSHVSQMTA